MSSNSTLPPQPQLPSTSFDLSETWSPLLIGALLGIMLWGIQALQLYVSSLLLPLLISRYYTVQVLVLCTVRYLPNRDLFEARALILSIYSHLISTQSYPRDKLALKLYTVFLFLTGTAQIIVLVGLSE